MLRRPGVSCSMHQMLAQVLSTKAFAYDGEIGLITVQTANSIDTHMCVQYIANVEGSIQ